MISSCRGEMILVPQVTTKRFNGLKLDEDEISLRAYSYQFEVLNESVQCNLRKNVEKSVHTSAWFVFSDKALVVLLLRTGHGISELIDVYITKLPKSATFSRIPFIWRPICVLVIPNRARNQYLSYS